MASIRGVLELVKNLSVIAFLGVVYVIGLSVKTLFQASKKRLPQVHAAGSQVRNWFRWPVRRYW